MGERMTYRQIEERFAGEWVVVRDFVRDDATVIKEGVVVAHTSDRTAAHRALDTFDDAFAIWFVGGPNPDFYGILSLQRTPPRHRPGVRHRRGVGVAGAAHSGTSLTPTFENRGGPTSALLAASPKTEYVS